MFSDFEIVYKQYCYHFFIF